MGDTKDYRAQMPPKLSQTRTTTGGHSQAPITRQGTHTQLKTGGMTLQPEPHSSPTMPAEENGFAPDVVSADTGNDAQDQQTEQPPIEQTTEKPEPVGTSARPPEGGGESDPVPGDADPGPTGGAKKPGYPSMLDEELNHPSGYSGKTAR
jgi:hypothetical protein